jgi:hypothetical protein
MAQSIAYYYQQIIDAKNSNVVLKDQLLPDSSVQENLTTLLGQLNSSSKVAIWRLWAWITATIIWTADKLFDATRDEMETIAKNAQVPNDKWLINKSLRFRYNPSTQQIEILVQDPVSKQFIYPTPLSPPLVELVKRASIIQANSGFTNLMVAKAGASVGTFAPLSTIELSAFRSYIYEFVQIVGTNVQIFSEPNDFLGYDIVVRYDFTRGVPNPEQAIRDAIADALKEVDSNGRLERLKLEDKVQSVTGVVGITGDWKAKGNASTEYIFFQGFYQTISGYIVPSTVPNEIKLKIIESQ